MIYDCFTFFNELELLEIRLNTLNNSVDKFVLVEATCTHQGKPKPLYFQENKELFKDFKNRIIHVVAEDMPAFNGENSWELEHHQRNAIVRGLEGCSTEDIILISDLDEIPKLSGINFEEVKEKDVYIFRQKMYYYFLNCMNATENANYRWNGTILYRYSRKIQVQALRELSMSNLGLKSSQLKRRMYAHYLKWLKSKLLGINIRFVEEGGWHFSYLGGVNKIIQKLEAFAHTEYNQSQYKSPEKIQEIIESGKDLFGRDFKYKFVPLDDSYPEYILKHIDKYKHLIKV